MSNKNILKDDVTNLDVAIDKISTVLNDIGMYLDDDSNYPETPCERSRLEMTRTRLSIVFDYINQMEKTVNNMYDHVK